MATKTDDLEDIPIEKGSLNFMIGQMTGAISSLTSRITTLEGRMDKMENKITDLDNRIWGFMLVIVVGIGVQILLAVK